MHSDSCVVETASVCEICLQDKNAGLITGEEGPDYFY